MALDLDGDTILTRDGDTVDGAIWRERALGPDDIARVLDLNPGLAKRGPVLAAGIAIRVPPPIERAAPVLDIVQLWS